MMQGIASYKEKRNQKLAKARLSSKFHSVIKYPTRENTVEFTIVNSSILY